MSWVGILAMSLALALVLYELLFELTIIPIVDEQVAEPLEREIGKTKKTKEDQLRALALKRGYSNQQFNIAYGIAKKIKHNGYVRNAAKRAKSLDDAFNVGKEIPPVKIGQVMKDSRVKNIA